jgi:glycosyltransferase involved in cell wall biosynthesis
MKVTFITPLTRLENIYTIYQSIVDAVGAENKWYWYIVEDGNRVETEKVELPFPNTTYISFPSNGKGISGNPQRNIALDNITDGYVYFLDDDNLVHPALLSRANAIIGNTGKSLIFAQRWKLGRVRLIPTPTTIIPCHIDTAQFLIDRKLIGELRWEPFNYCADGNFFSALYKENKDKFIITTESLCFYNFLRGNE